MCNQCQCACNKVDTVAELATKVTRLIRDLECTERYRKEWMERALNSEKKLVADRKTINDLRTTVKTLVNFKETENV